MVTMSCCFEPINSRQIHSGGKCQNQTTQLMVMEQRQVEELAGVLLFSLEMGSQWPKDHPYRHPHHEALGTKSLTHRPLGIPQIHSTTISTARAWWKHSP